MLYKSHWLLFLKCKHYYKRTNKCSKTELKKCSMTLCESIEDYLADRRCEILSVNSDLL